MNKTVNINLAGVLFHIDEDAFQKLQEYLTILKKAYANEPGADEIISDIEARIAELFNEAKQHDSQVIDIKNVDGVISIMGHPEDLFDDDEQAVPPKKENNREDSIEKKQLFRDISDAYISGVSSGLSHYFQVSTVWIRLAWLLLVFFSGGTFILLYLSLWFFVPVAKTTAEKLAMKGKSVNVNNIEEKIKEGFNSVADTVKNAYHKSNGEEIKNKSAIVVSKLELAIGRFFKILGRLLGILLMFTSGLINIVLFAGFWGINSNLSEELSPVQRSEYTRFLTELDTPLWLSSALLFLTIAIPLFFIFILGLKISFPNVKKISLTVILSLIGAWLLSAIAIFIFQLSNGNINFVTASTSNEEILDITSSDTLKVFMRKQDQYINHFNSNDDFLLRETIDGQKVLVYRDIMIYVKTTKTENPQIRIKKQAEGPNYNNALELAKKIDFNYLFENNTLFLDGYALGNYDDKFRGQKVKIFLTLPENITLFAHPSTRDYNNKRKPGLFAIIKNKENHFLKLKKGKVKCTDCLNDQSNNNNIDININFDDENFENELEDKIEQIIEDNISVKNGNNHLNSKNFNIKINEDGIQIKSSEENTN